MSEFVGGVGFDTVGGRVCRGLNGARSCCLLFRWPSWQLSLRPDSQLEATPRRVTLIHWSLHTIAFMQRTATDKNWCWVLWEAQVCQPYAAGLQRIGVPGCTAVRCPRQPALPRRTRAFLPPPKLEPGCILSEIDVQIPIADLAAAEEVHVRAVDETMNTQPEK